MSEPIPELPTFSLKDKVTNAIIGTVFGLILAIGGWVSNKVSDHIGEISALRTRVDMVERTFERIEFKLDRALKNVEKQP